MAKVDFDLDLDEETFVLVALEAHKRDITFNAMIELILRAVIDKQELPLYP